MRTEFRLLGPLEVVEDGRLLPLGGPQERKLLALLLLRRNHVVSRERIVEELWDGSPPRSAANVVHKHVSRLRKSLDERVVTKDSGYLLRVEPGEVDADRFTILVREAHAAGGAGDAEGALVLLDEALGLWRDEPLSDLVLGGVAAREADALEEQRSGAREERIELHLGRGVGAELVAELRELVRRYPLRERLRRQLMLALYRSGRQADALAVYRDARHEFVEVLGIEPSEMLRELERRILVHDDSLAVPATAASSAAPLSAPAREPPGERGTVCVVVMELGGREGRELDVEDAEALVGPWSERVVEEVVRFGGTIEQRLGDTLYALFGAQSVHEDDVERAVRAALACRTLLAGAGLELRAGVAFGDVLMRRRNGTFEVHGNVASSAARLAAHGSPGTIVATDRVRRAVAHAVKFRAADGAWEVLAATSELGTHLLRSGRAGFVGRERELEALTRVVERTRDERTPQIVTLIGAPGIGKSRLLLELRRTHDAGAVAWLEARSAPYGDGLAFWPLAQLVKARAGILDSDGPHRAREKLRATVSPLGMANAEWMVEQLERLVAPAHEMQEDPGRDAAFAAWLRFFEALAIETPLVLVFDDLHWADEGTLDFLAHLGASVVDAPLLVLCTTRPELLERRPGWGGGARDAASIALAPLATGDVAELLTALLGGAPSQALRQWLVERVDGNPLFAEEFIRVLIEGELLDCDERGAWRLRDDAAARMLPDSVHGIIAARIDALPPEQRALVRDASVVGQVFWAGAVAALAADASALDLPLRALSRRDFVQRENGSQFERQEQYAFKHALICEVAYRQLRRRDRAAKHRLTAEWFERHAQAEDAAELIAHHRWQALELGLADDPELTRQTLAALARAGERARSLYAHADAASYLRLALELAERDGADPGRERRAALEEALGDVIVLGDPDAGREAYERALALISPASRLGRGRLHRKRGATYPFDQEPGRAEALVAFAEAEAALGAPLPAKPSWWEERIELEFDRLQHLHFTGTTPAFSAALKQTMPLVARHGTPLQNARLLHHLAIEQVQRDLCVVESLTIDRVRRGLATVEATGNLPLICSWRFTLGFVLLFAGKVDEAEGRLLSSLELASAIGDTTRRVRALCYLALGHRLRGDVRRTDETARTALAAALEARMRMYAAQAEAHLAWVAHREQRSAEVREHLDRAWQMWETGDLPQAPFQWMMLWPALGLAAADGRYEEALDCARRLLAPKCQPPPESLRERLAGAVAAADSGDPASAQTLLAQAIELAPADGML